MTSSEQQEQLFHRFFVKPDYQMDFIEIRDSERLLEFCEIFGLEDDSEKLITKYFKSETNIIIYDNEKSRLLIFDENGGMVDAFFPVS